MTRSAEEAGAGEGTVRRMLLAVVLVGTAGLLLELFLLEHTESAWQWAPMAVLGLGLLSGMLLGARPSRRVVRLFGAVMLLFLATSLAGIYLHYRGNAEFEREMDASASGLVLLWRAARGATPALAPGAMAQLGLLGLILCYRHPALAAPSAAASRRD